MKKVTMSLFMMVLFVSGFVTPAFSAQEIDSVNTEAVQQEEATDPVGPSTRTLFLTAWGKTKGDIVSYRPGVKNTGVISVHFNATNTGFQDGDKAVYTLMLPEELKEVAAQPDFNEKFEGTIRNTSFLHERKTQIRPDMVEAYSDRVYLSIPSGCWIGVGETRIDFKIKYGEILAANPKLDIKDNEFGGYKFKSGLRYTSAPWDVIKVPILGSDGSKWTSEELEMITRRDDSVIDVATFTKGQKVIKGTYTGDGEDIADSKVVLNGEDLEIRHDDGSFFRNKVNIAVANKMAEVEEDDFVMIKTYDYNGKLLDVAEVELVNF